MQKILIVEDDEKLRKEFEIFLNNNGYESISLKTFENTLNDILEIKPKLLLLDINLPGIYGEYICKELRKVINISVICLMLFMTITSLSSSIALKNSMQKDMEKMTPVDINLYKTAILKDSEEIINDSKKQLLPSVIMTVIVMIIIYGCYFLATYIGNKNIIKNDE